MAGLAAAWRLTRPEGPGADVTVYQRGFRLGGKGASSRGPHGRIQEHGLHVWPGYYDNAFRMMAACYEELDRSHTDPAVPIQTFGDAFFAASTIGLVGEGAAMPWVATFPENDFRPDLRHQADAGLLRPGDLLQRGARPPRNCCRVARGDRAGGASRCSAPAGTRHHVHRQPGVGATGLQVRRRPHSAAVSRNSSAP